MANTTKTNTKKTNTRTNTNKSTRSTKATKPKSATKSNIKSTSGQAVASANKIKKEKDPILAESRKDIILWAALAVSILLFISNFGFSGKVGSFVGGFLFGVFGIVQYILPILLIASIFFLIANDGSATSIIKVTSVSVMSLFVSVIAELIVHKSDAIGAIEAFKYSRENRNAGGFLGGAIAGFLTNSFGIVIAYIVCIIVLLICISFLFDFSVFDAIKNYNEYAARASETKRRRIREANRYKRQLMQEENERRNQAKLEKQKAEIERQVEENRVIDGARINRKHTGITLNTTMVSPEPIVQPDFKESVEEIKPADFVDDRNIEVTDTSRVILTSNTTARVSSHKFGLTEPAEAPVINNEVIQLEEQARAAEELKARQEAEEQARLAEAKANEQAAMEQARIKLEEQQRLERQAREAEEQAKRAAEEQAKLEQQRLIRQQEEAKKAAQAQAQVTPSSTSSLRAQTGSVPSAEYKLPPISLLNEPKTKPGASGSGAQEMMNTLARTLNNFGVDAEVTGYTQGPSVTRFEIKPAEGVKVSKIVNLTDDIKLNMAVTDLRIEAPIPGKNLIGIEVPNKEKTMVSFRELVASNEFQNDKSKISFCVGKDISGQVIVGNIEKMPHLLIAGATGSGKSVCMNTIIMSILYHANPDEVKLIMVDPKVVELSVYNGIPHLLVPVVTDPKKAAGALHWAVTEMDNRYKYLAAAGVRNLEAFNDKIRVGGLDVEIKDVNTGKLIDKPLPQIVVILDELADLMMVAAGDVEESICRIAQLARAAGIHLVIATQRPTSNVITGLIKGNVPSRIAFSVASAIDSRVILDMSGAEDLLGNGDMLYSPQNLSKPVRIQGAYVSEEEVQRVVEFIRTENAAVISEAQSTSPDISEQIAAVESANKVAISDGEDNGRDPLIVDAGRLVIENEKGSIGYLQRNFRIGFNRAARIMDQLCELGVVGPEIGTKPREIKMSISQFEELINNL